MSHLLEVDESIERALRETSLDGKHDLMQDLVRGNHARTVIAEINHTNNLKEAYQQSFDSRSDFEFQLEAILPAASFHLAAQNEGSYELFDTDKSDYVEWVKRRFPENKIRQQSKRTLITVGNKYGPPAL